MGRSLLPVVAPVHHDHATVCYTTDTTHHADQDGHTLTHVDTHGKASMVGVANKKVSHRVAMASGKILLGDIAYDLVAKNNIAKGDVLTVAQLAGIMGAKQTSNLIPLCHPLTLDKIKVDLSLEPADLAVKVVASVEVTGKTGVEMEALTGVSVALLTVYDMCKAVNKQMVITNIKLEMKTGGKSDFSAK